MIATDRYDSLIRWYWMDAIARYGFDDVVDWRLVKAQVKKESDFMPRALNQKSGASGLLQLEPNTWGEGFANDRFDPELNLMKGIRALGDKWSIFRKETGLERWKLALGAYNAGEKHIIDAQTLCERHQRPTDQWIELAQVLPLLTGTDNARETVDYVRTIIADYLAMKVAAA